MADAPKSKFVVFHGRVKVGSPKVDPLTGKEHDGHIGFGDEIELTEFQAKSMDPKGETLMPVAQFEALKKASAANAELEHKRIKDAVAKGKKKATAAPSTVALALERLTQQAMQQLAAEDTGIVEEEEPKKPRPSPPSHEKSKK